MSAELSPTMEKALRAATQFGGGKLTRFPGGFWRIEARHPWSCGTSTIEALVSRGKMKYTQWQERSKGGAPFPIEAQVVDLSVDADH